MSAPKPLQVNPIKLSAPLGAHLALLGVDMAMPIIHGAQGCANYSKVLFTRHFNEPIAVASTAVNEITAIMDGGKEISESVINISKKANPKLIAIISTGLTETKGDDMASAVKRLDKRSVFVSTPDYIGGLEEGFAKAQKALIEQLTKEEEYIDESRIALLPNVSLSPLEVEKLKEFINSFGFITTALPDLSGSLDGHLGKKQGSVAQGGVDVELIESLARSHAVITVGSSPSIARDALKKKNPAIKEINIPSLYGLRESDALATALLELKGVKPPKTLRVWRERLQDIYLDSHFETGKLRVCLALESDEAYGIASILQEVGASVSFVVTPTKGGSFDSLGIERIVGDLEDVEKRVDEFDLLITNFHGKRVCKKYGKTLILRGYPNYDEIGVGLKNDILYEGGCFLLREIVNKVRTSHEH